MILLSTYPYKISPQFLGNSSPALIMKYSINFWQFCFKDLFIERKQKRKKRRRIYKSFADTLWTIRLTKSVSISRKTNNNCYHFGWAYNYEGFGGAGTSTVPSSICMTFFVVGRYGSPWMHQNFITVHILQKITKISYRI